MKVHVMMFLSLMVATSVGLRVVGDTVLATSTSVVFRLNTVDSSSYKVSSLSEIENLMPVTWRSNETVTVTSPGGTVDTLVTSADAAGSVSVSPDCGGVWMFENSVQGTVFIGIPWDVFGDGGTLAASAAAGYRLDTKSPGPNRRVHTQELLRIAYSGDEWVGRADCAESVLTLTSPSGVSSNVTLNGTGAFVAHLEEQGTWMVTLETAAMSRSGFINAIPKLFFITYR